MRERTNSFFLTVKFHATIVEIFARDISTITDAIFEMIIYKLKYSLNK